MKVLKVRAKILTSLLFVICTSVFMFGYYRVMAEEEEYDESELTWDITEDTTWEKGNLVIDRAVNVYNGAELTIEPGTKITFKKDKRGFATNLMVWDGSVDAQGTTKEPITFSSDTGNDRQPIIDFEGVYNEDGRVISQPSFFRYVDITKGGESPKNHGCQGCSVFDDFFRKIISTAYAYFDVEGVPAMKFRGGKLHIENSRFYKNEGKDIDVDIEVRFRNQDDNLEVVNSNFEDNADNVAVVANIWGDEKDENDSVKVTLKNNWYGDKNGPSGTNDNNSTRGEKVVGDVDLLNSRKSELIADPVIIIPGITGSEKVDGQWELDPILHLYDNLYNSFIDNGYEKDINLFKFPYEWRNSNETSISLLKSKVEEITNQTKVSKVDLVGHSMGGLVARGYVEEIGDDIKYGDDVDQLIMLGTPNKGAPKSYLEWEAGEGFFSGKDEIAKHHFTMESLHEGFDSLQEYIQQRVPSVGELLPDYDYLFDVKENKMKSYPENYPVNKFLEKLNNDENIKKLNKVSVINIIGGANDDKKTISGMKVVDSTVFRKWKHGMPENFYNTDSSQGLEYSNGDGTVPKSSAEAEGIISPDKTIKLESTHGDLPSKAQCKIIQELTDKQVCFTNNTWHVPDLLMINIFSPVDIQVVAPDGKKIGKDFENGKVINQIDGAYYSGFDTKNEFLTIPNPEEGEYKIIAQGTGDGEYTIKATRIWNVTDDSDEAKEAEVTIIDNTVCNEKQEKFFTLPRKTTDNPEEANETSSDSSDDDGDDHDKKDKDNDKKENKKTQTNNAASSNIDNFFEPKRYQSVEDAKVSNSEVKGEAVADNQNDENKNAKGGGTWFYAALSVGILLIILGMYFSEKKEKY